MSVKPGSSATAEFTARLQAAVQLDRGGRSAEAAGAYRALMSAYPGRPEAAVNLGRLLLLMNQPKEAAEMLTLASRLLPKSAQVLTNLGLALAMQGETKRALANYRKAIAAEPRYVEAHFNLGRALAGEGHDDEARVALETAVQLAPGYVDAHCSLAELLVTKERFTEAVASYRCALAIRPHDPFILYNLGNVRLSLAEPVEAIVCFAQALAIMPTHAEAHHAMGLALQMQGKFADAERHHAEAVRLKPSNGRFLRDLVELRVPAPDDRLFDWMKNIAGNPKQPDPQNLVHVHAALGAAYEKRGAHDEAFSHFLRANALERALVDFDDAEMDALFAHVRTIFSAERLAAAPAEASRSELPLFIVGMPRSGSTLLEQILGAHSRVFGAGEIHELSHAIENLGRGRFDTREFLTHVPRFPPARLASIGHDYVAHLKARAPDALRITDKFLSNFLCIGLIRMVLPNARIVHTIRNPLDVCISRFTKVFVPGSTYSYDLSELGRYHRRYEALMAHWRAVLPPGAMHEIVYEELVADPEQQVRRLLDYCDLDWEDGCLQFHASPRIVATPSRRQVRERLNANSVATWMRYKKHLGALFAALEMTPPV